MTNSDLAHDVLPRGDIDTQELLEARPGLGSLVQVHELACDVNAELCEIDP